MLARPRHRLHPLRHGGRLRRRRDGGAPRARPRRANATSSSPPRSAPTARPSRHGSASRPTTCARRVQASLKRLRRERIELVPPPQPERRDAHGGRRGRRPHGPEEGGHGRPLGGRGRATRRSRAPRSTRAPRSSRSPTTCCTRSTCTASPVTLMVSGVGRPGALAARVRAARRDCGRRTASFRAAATTAPSAGRSSSSSDGVEQLDAVRFLVKGDVHTMRAAAVRFVLANHLVSSAVLGPRSRRAARAARARDRLRADATCPTRTSRRCPRALSRVGILT